MRVRAIFIAVFLLAMLAIGGAYAQQEAVDMTKIEDIPSYASELSKKDFEEQSELYEEEPLGDKFLAYHVRLPRGWTKVTTANNTFKKKEVEKAGLSQRLLGMIAKYYGPGRIDALSRFEIEAQSLQFEVTAKNWFMQEVLTRGYVLEGLKVLSERRVEALYVVVDGDTSYVVRAVAEINGPRMVVASYFVPDVHWKEERAFQQRAIESFNFVSPEKTKIEMTRTYAFLDLLSFEYPASWRLVAPNIYSIEGMEASLLYSIDDKTLGGEIHISIVSSEYENSLAEEIKFLKQDMTSRGLVIGDLIETRDNYKVPKHVFYNHVEVYRASDAYNKILEHEYWVSIMEEDRYYYIVTMLTPSRNSEFYSWARNEEAFRTVVESFRP